MGFHSGWPLERPPLQDFADDFPAPLPPAQMELEKISGCLIELARGLVGDDDGPGPWRAGIDLAAIAWNLSFLPRETREREMRELLGEIEERADIDSDELRVLLEALMERKRLLYPDDRRRVLKWEVKTSHRRIHVLAVSLLPDDATGRHGEEFSPAVSFWDVGGR